MPDRGLIHNLLLHHREQRDAAEMRIRKLQSVRLRDGVISDEERAERESWFRHHTFIAGLEILDRPLEHPLTAEAVVEAVRQLTTPFQCVSICNLAREFSAVK